MARADIAIVGGGQAGLASAYAARRAGLTPVVLEAGDEPVGSWVRYYDSLELFSPARFSELPGLPFEGDPDRYPTRDALVVYLRRYAATLDADIRTGWRVTSVEPLEDGGFEVLGAHGGGVVADRVFAASGGFGAPHLPRLAGLDGFAGEAIHSGAYRTPEPYAGRRVLVVGGGDSAMQIAAELAEVARVTITTRSPLRFMPQRVLGRDMHWWLIRTGLDSSALGLRIISAAGRRVVDDGAYRRAIAAGAPDTRPMFDRLDGGDVIWADGEREPVDAVILATGYRPEVSFLAGSGALDDDGLPLHRHGVSTTVPGLGYVGLEFQRSFASATVRGVGRDAEFVLGRLLTQDARSPQPLRRIAWSPRCGAPAAR